MQSDGWDTEPFKLVNDKQSGKLIGRGSTDDKGPVLGWVNVLQAHKELGIPLPVNLKFCFEGMEESGSEGLDELIQKEAKGFFKNVDAVCIVRAAFVSLAFIVMLMRLVIIVRQLLAEHTHAVLDLRTSRADLLQTDCPWPISRSPFRCIWKHSPRADDRSYPPLGNAREYRGRDPYQRRK